MHYKVWILVVIPTKTRFIQNCQLDWHHQSYKNNLANWSLVQAQIVLPLTQMIYSSVQYGPQKWKQTNKKKMEMNIPDIFQRGKRKSLEVGSFHSALHSNCTFYPKRSSTLQVTTISTLLCAAISGVGHRREKLNTSKGMGAKMLTGKGSIPKLPQDNCIQKAYTRHTAQATTVC